MKKISIFASLSFLIIFIIAIVFHKKPSDKFDSMSFPEIESELKKLEPYAKKVKEENIFFFDYKKALKDGFPEQVVMLQKEIIDRQNEMIQKFKIGKGSLFEPVDEKKYPRLAKYIEVFNKYYTELHKSENSGPGEMYSTMDLGDIERSITEMSGYVKQIEKDGVKIQVFDEEAARKNKEPEETISLIKEIVDFQNDMMMKIKAGKSGVFGPVDKKKYPRLYYWDKLASEFRNIRKGNIKSEHHPCGTKENPVPDFSPLRKYYKSENPEKSLLDMGFHHTSPYACGEYKKDCSKVDFTRGRDYSGPYGYCDSPIFRDQGIIESKDTFSIQYGEPNPEIHEYNWPYLFWPVYVNWWHENY